LVRLAAHQLGYSAVKESRAGRMTETTLNDIVQDVELIEELVSTLPKFGGPQEYQNEWAEQTFKQNSDETDSSNSNKTGNFNGPAVLKHSIKADLSKFYGDSLKIEATAPLDFSLLPKSKSDIGDSVHLSLSTLILTLKLSKEIDAKSRVRPSTRMMEIASLIEYVLLQLVPTPSFNNNTECWKVDCAETYYDLVETIDELSAIYTATCESMILKYSQPTRVITHTTLAIMYYHVLRQGPNKDILTRTASGSETKCNSSFNEYELLKILPRSAVVNKLKKDKTHESTSTREFLKGRLERKIIVDIELSKGLQTRGFPTESFLNREDYLQISSNLLLDKPILVRARSETCEYITDMKNHTLGVSIFSHANNMGKFSQHEPNLKFVEGLRRSASINGVKILQDKYPPNVAAMLENREKKTTLSDCQLFVGWYTVDVNKNDSDVTNTLVRLCMHTVYRSRDYFARFQFNLRQLSLGTGDIFEFETFKSAAEWKYKYDKKKKGCKCKFKFGPYVIGSEVPNPPRYPAPLCDPINYVDVANGKTVNEDDILHEDLLKDFNGNISQEEAEQLYTYLTTPYMRIPLIVNFFSRERVGCLFDPDLQSLLEQTLFVPGIWGKLNVDDGRNVESVPCKPELLNTNHGYLVAELERGPLITLKSFHSLLEEGLKLSVGNYKSSFVDVMLYLFRINIKMLTFVQNVMDSKLSSENDTLIHYDGLLTKWMDSVLGLIETWLAEAQLEDSNYEASVFHAHLAMSAWTSTATGMDTKMCSRMISSCCFLRTSHISRSGVGMLEKGQKKKAANKEADEMEDENVSAHLGVPEQDMYWLVQSKRENILQLLQNESTENIQHMLLNAIQVTTNDIKSYHEWKVNSAIDENCVTNQLNQVTTYVDGSNTFYIDVQNSRLSYQSATFSPVPESITRLSDFKNYFKNVVPNCAKLIKGSYFESVLVSKGNLLLESWEYMPSGGELEILGTPSTSKEIDGGGDSKEIVWETKHPYKDREDQKKTFFMKGAPALIVSFSPLSATEEHYDTLNIFDKNGKKKTLSGKKAFQQIYEFNGDTIKIKWASDSGGKEYWGIKMTVKCQSAIDTDSIYYYGGIKYGGHDRTWKYETSAPNDCSWIEPIMNPIIHDCFTKDPKRGRGKIRWIKYNTEPNVQVEASETFLLLPSHPLTAKDLTVTLLMVTPKQDIWKIVTCNKLYHCAEVYDIDLFGRRGYPKLCYSSDSRFSIGRLSPDKHAEPLLFPPSSITRFAIGDVKNGITGGKDVVITDQNEGEDGLGPRMLLPGRVTNGIVPGALSESFDFWELKNSGDWIGNKKKLTRQTQKGDVVPYVDAFYDYNVEVRFIKQGLTTAVVRTDVNPITLQETGRRLINLAVSNDKSSLEIVRLLTQIESLSHILAWSKSIENYEDSFSDENLIPDIIDCPRLRARFSVCRNDDGSIRLYLVDSGGKYAMMDQLNSGVNSNLLAGIPSRLILGRSSGNIYIMLPNCPLIRPEIAFCPFTTSTRTDMADPIWHYSCNSRYYLYEVHPSDTFVLFNSIGATLYWAFLKLLHREYIDAYQAIVSCGTDMRLTWSEFTMLSYFKSCDKDHHPNAHACRLKLRLALQYSPIKKWPVCENGGAGGKSPFASNYSSYLTKRRHVSLACRLTQNEEMIIMTMLEEAKVRKIVKNPDLQSRKSLIDYVRKEEAAARGETKMSSTDKYKVTYSGQNNGGADYKRKAVNIINSKGENCDKFVKNKSHWISNVDVIQECFNGTYEGKNCLALIDKLWDMKMEEGFYSQVLSLMNGNVTAQISSTGSSSKLLSTQYLTHMLTRWVFYRRRSIIEIHFLIDHFTGSILCSVVGVPFKCMDINSFHVIWFFLFFFCSFFSSACY
jgi:hypothetical protein